MSINLYDSSEEYQLLRKTVRDFAARELAPQALEFDRKEKFNLPLFRKLGDLGLLGITVPTEFGGSGLDAVAAVVAHEELSSVDPGFCLAYLAHSMLCVNNICVNASDAQRHQFLPKLCSGEWIGAMGMSEPGAGTDVLGMSTVAQADKDNFVLNGRKMWITNGCIDDKGTPCDLLYVYARNPESTRTSNSLSSFIVLGSDKGFSVGQKIMDKAGMRASNTAELCLDDCKIPASRLVGAPGSALSHMVRNLEIERITLAAMGIGIARRCIEVMVRYANERRAFGHKISTFGQIQSHIADSYAEYRAARAYVYLTAHNLSLTDSGQRLDSDGVKLIASRCAKMVADRAIQVLGGYGYVGEYSVERLWRDAKLLEIGGGTIEAHQKNICTDLGKLEHIE